MKASSRFNKLGTGIFARNDLRKKLYNKNQYGSRKPTLIDFSLGSSDLLPPAAVIKAIQKNLENPLSFSYSLHSSTNAFRESVSAWAKSRFDVNVDPEREILLLVGSQEGTAHLPLAVVNPGDHGLILDPSYPSHLGGLLLADANVERLRLFESDSWKPVWNSLKTSQYEQLSIAVLGYPHNPTAQVGDQALLEELMFIAGKYNFVVANDNPYVDLAIEGKAPSLLFCQGWREFGIEFFSFSKAWNMGGLRVAFAIGAEPIITALRGVKNIVDFNQSFAIQAGAIAAFEEAPDFPKKVLNTYKIRRDKTTLELKKLGWNIPISTMAMYLWIPLPAWAINLGWNDEDFAKELLSNTGVALMPGSGFGHGGQDWIRMALVKPLYELEEAINRISVWCNEFN